MIGPTLPPILANLLGGWVNEGRGLDQPFKLPGKIQNGFLILNEEFQTGSQDEIKKDL